MLMYYTYILKSLSDNIHYYGQTENLQKRVEEHNFGLSGYTKKHLPWKLIYFEEYSTRSEAMMREKFFKTIAGHKWLKESNMI